MSNTRPQTDTNTLREAEIRERYPDSLVLSFDVLDLKIAEHLKLKLPTLTDGCLCKWTRVSEDRACGNHSQAIWQLRQVKDLFKKEHTRLLNDLLKAKNYYQDWLEDGKRIEAVPVETITKYMEE